MTNRCYWKKIKKRDSFRASSYTYMYIHIVNCTHCPAISVAREEEEIRKEEKKRENVNYLMKVYRIKNGRMCESISPLIR